MTDLKALTSTYKSLGALYLLSRSKNDIDQVSVVFSLKSLGVSHTDTLLLDNRLLLILKLHLNNFVFSLCQIFVLWCCFQNRHSNRTVMSVDEQKSTAFLPQKTVSSQGQVCNQSRVNQFYLIISLYVYASLKCTYLEKRFISTFICIIVNRE